MQLFSSQWQNAWLEQLQNSQSYKSAAKTWQGALILTVGDEHRFFLDLEGGDCHDIRNATAEDQCRFELAAPKATWLDLLEKGTDPIYLVMRGKLKVAQGSKAQLLPYSKAAKEMLKAARQIEGVIYE